MKQNTILIIAFALPLLLVLIVAASIYIPSLFLKTEHDFVYATCDAGRYYYGCEGYLNKKYTITNGRLEKNAIEESIDVSVIKDVPTENDIRFFMHDTEKNESTEVSFQEAQSYSFDSRVTSPDGVSFKDTYDRGVGVFPFFYDGSSRYFALSKGNAEKKLNLIVDESSYYRNQLKFIGWVIGE